MVPGGASVGEDGGDRLRVASVTPVATHIDGKLLFPPRCSRTGLG